MGKENLKRERTILVIGANPAWQKTLFFDQFAIDQVNRAVRFDAYPAGKGANFCRAVRYHGGCSTRLFQFVGGENGRRFENALRQEKLAFESVQVEAETRCCITCLEPEAGTMTELIEPSLPIPRTAASKLLARLEKKMSEAAGMAICGSRPPGIEAGFYWAAAALARQAHIPVLLDVSASIEPILAAGGLLLLKINDEELRRLTGKHSVPSGIRCAHERWPEIVIAVTAGADDAFLAADGKIRRFILPRLDSVTNPLGSGDTASAVFFSEYLAGSPHGEAFASALAAASANCLTPCCGKFNPADRDRLRKAIKIEVIV